jgi:hypothetical protein
MCEATSFVMLGVALRFRILPAAYKRRRSSSSSSSFLYSLFVPKAHFLYN